MNMLLEDVLRVEELSEEKFAKVVRMTGRSDIYELRVVADLYREFFCPRPGAVVSFALGQDKSRRQGAYDAGEDYSREPFASWTYVTFGKVFEVKELDKENAQVNISFGGLLLGLWGKKFHLGRLQLGDSVYCFMKESL